MGERQRPEEALFDEYGNLEPQAEGAQITPLLRLCGVLHGAPASEAVSQSLLDGALPIPCVTWSTLEVELRATAVAHAGEALVEYRVTNKDSRRQDGALVLAVRPVQINPYWQHGGHAAIDAIAVDGRQVSVNDHVFAAFSREPDFISVADFDNGDVIRLIENEPRQTVRRLRSVSGLLSAACEFRFSLEPGRSVAFVLSSPMWDGVTPHPDISFCAVHEEVARGWRKKIG